MAAKWAFMSTIAPAEVVTEAVVSPPIPLSPSVRLSSMDAYRGFVMLLMASEGFNIPRVADQFKESVFWQFLKFHTDHVEWVGGGLWDMIQPSFSFLVGVALPYSVANRLAKGDSYKQVFKHAIIRSLILIFLGVLLRSDHKQQTYFTFEDTLSQIGLGYTFLFLLWNRPLKLQIGVLSAILVGYWAAFALFPLPRSGFDYASVGAPLTWHHHPTGFAAHWDKNTNFANWFDQWFLNLFPREKPFVYNGGGYLTLSFIPTLGTMILGLLCGQILRNEKSAAEKIKIMVITGVSLIVAGQLLGVLGICPVVKRIWTPTWTLYSGGIAFLFMAAFYYVIDVKDRKGWAFPLIIVGMNSIAMYVMAHIFYGLIERNLKTNLGQTFYEHVAGVYAPILEGVLVLFFLWLICWWMYRRKLFIRI